MRKNILTLSLVVVLMVSGFVSLVYAITAEPNVNFYGCDTSLIESTMQVDTDGDGHYDTYIVNWCPPYPQKTYPVQYGFKGLDIDALEDEIGPRPYDKPLPKQKPKKKAKIVMSNPLTGAFKEVVYEDSTGLTSWWWEKNDIDDFVVLNLPVANPRISINDNQFGGTSSNVALLPDPNTSNVKFYFSVSEQNRVTINVYNQAGMNVATLLDADRSYGNHEVSFNTASLPNGLYFVHSKIGTSVFTQKLLLAK